MNVARLFYCCSYLYYFLPMLILSCLAFNTLDGKHYISRLVVAMFILSVLFCFPIIKNNLNDSRVKKVIFFWLSFAIILSLYHVFRGESFSTPRTIFVSLLYLIVVPWHLISRLTVLSVILIGGCVAGGHSLYEYLILNVHRVGGIINQIPFALYAAFTLIIAVDTLWCHRNKFMKMLALLSMLGSSFSVIMSEVRGVWLALICIALFLCVEKCKKKSSKSITAIVAVTAILFTLLSVIPDVSNRINETKMEFTQIFNGNKDTSIGIRLQLWASAIDVIKDHPLMGVGTTKYREIMEQQYQDGMITKVVLSFKNAHYHNQYLDSYVRYGVMGLIIAILMCLSPFLLYRHWDTYLSKLVFATSILFLVAGLTDVPFIHTGIIYILVLYPAVIFLSNSHETHKG